MNVSSEDASELALLPMRDEIEQFLSMACPGAIQFVAIAEGQVPIARWFGEDIAGATDWAFKKNAERCNIYFSVNEVRKGLNRKASKNDIAAIRFAHVDIDPPKHGGEWDKKAVVLALELLSIPPKFIIDSGGGIQAFWPIEGGASAEDIERINLAIAENLGGDKCHNLDRVMRVPGTVNWPCARKRARGRVPVRARMFPPIGTAYRVSELAEAFCEEADNTSALNSKNDLIGFSSKALRSDLTAVLGISRNSILYQLITAPSGTDRSKDTFAVACEMVRCGYSDAQIVELLLDPTHPISEHCLDQADPERAARRAAERARKSLNVVPAAIDRGDRSSISAHLFTRPEASQIPPRPWLYGTQLQRGLLSLLIAPGGTGKTAYTVGMALALASGRDLLATKTARPLTVWLYNLEDPLDELNRAITAGCIEHELSPEQFADRLFVNSGVDHSALCTAVQTRDGVQMSEEVIVRLVEELRDKKIDVLIIDPFVSTHQVNENDNGAIDAVAKAWAQVAFLANCAILLVHHTPKNLPTITADAARGASSLVNAARSVTTLNRMTSEEARKYGIEPEQARRFVRAYDDKNNRAPPADASHWYELVSVRLPNGTSDQEGDSVGVMVPWIPPTVQVERNLDSETLKRIARALETPGRESEQSPDWAGYVIARALELSADSPADKQMLKAVIRGALRLGAIEVFEAQDVRRKNVRWLRAVPAWLEDDAQLRDLDDVSGGADSRSGAGPGRATAPGAPPPLRGGGPGAEQGEENHG